MTLHCLICRATARYKNREEAIDAGWMGVEAETERIMIKFCLCPDCFSPEKAVELLKEKLGR